MSKKLSADAYGLNLLRAVVRELDQHKITDLNPLLSSLFHVSDNEYIILFCIFYECF